MYKHSTRSDFLVVNLTSNLKIRIEIKFQKTSGSVDEKLPYFYINSVTSHDDDVLFIVEGNGFKRGSKLWLKEKVNENWLNDNDKNIYMHDLVSSIKYLKEIL